MKVSVFVAVLTISSSLYAQTPPQNDSPPPQGQQQCQGAHSPGHRGPPPEALKACESKKADDACSFTGHRGTVTGTCWAPDTSKPLACHPAQPPPDQE